MTAPFEALAVNAAGILTNRVFLDDARLIRLLDLLNRDGETARVVGGAVRNAALGLAPGDIDVTTTAVPETVMARAKAAHLRAVPTGVAHGTVTVIVGAHPFEVTTLREDVETDGRHAVVRFGRDYALDALRRDFTINALSVEADGRIHDVAGGLDDLAARRVRFIGDPATRIREDYLRILRFFRFSAIYAEGDLDGPGLAAAVAGAPGLDSLSRERVRAELLKLLVAPRATEVVAAMDAVGLLATTVGLPCDPLRFARLRSIERAAGNRCDAIRGLAALAVRQPSDAVALRDALRLSNEERDRLTALAALLAERPAGDRPPDARTLSTLLFHHRRSIAIDAVMLWHADSTVPPVNTGWLAAARFAAIAVAPTLPVSGADIVARGIKSGPRVGQTLKAFQASWIRAGFPDTPAVLHDLLDKAIASSDEQS